MYNKLPNLILAFHGCDEKVYKRVIYNREALKSSYNSYDWLGSGVYFWEANHQRALEWAKEKVKREEYSKAAVIGAVIDLGYCLNLTDSSFVPLLKNGYTLLKSRVYNDGLEMPCNIGGDNNMLRYLDCAVIEHVHGYLRENGSKEFDSVRGIFVEGNEIYEGSGFYQNTHVQICVRNPNCIKGYFAPLQENPQFDLP